MKKFKPFFFLVLILFLFTSAYPQEIILYNGHTIDQYIEQAMARWNLPGMSVAIIRNGEVVFLKGYGVKELGKPDKVDENTIFSVASNTKAFTGTAIAMLESEGKLSLDDRIIKYFPDFMLYDTLASQMVTIKDLLTHRIGLGTFEGDFITWGTNFSRSDLIYKMRYIKPVYGFRNGYGYCNSGFLAAGEVIPIVTGKSWDEYIKEKFLIPLEMTRTITSTEAVTKMGNIAMPHTINNNYEMVPIPWRNVDNLAPATSICSSAKDMANWILMQTKGGVYKGNTIVDKRILLKTQTPYNVLNIPSYGTGNPTKRHFITYGLGWFLQDYKGKLVITHTGGYDGMLSRTAFMPEDNLGVVILTNNDQNNVYTSLMYQIFDYYFYPNSVNWDSLIYVNTKVGEDKARQEWEEIEKSKMPESLSSFDFGGIKGVYTNIQAGDAEIKEGNGKWIVTLSCRPGVEGYLELWHTDTLLCMYNDLVLGKCLFPLSIENGKVTGFELRVNDFVDPLYYEFRRKE